MAFGSYRIGSISGLSPLLGSGNGIVSHSGDPIGKTFIGPFIIGTTGRTQILEELAAPFKAGGSGGSVFANDTEKISHGPRVT